MKKRNGMKWIAMVLIMLMLSACATETTSSFSSSVPTASNQPTSSSQLTSSQPVSSQPDTSKPASSNPTTSSETKKEELYTSGDVRTYLQTHLPIMDGSTSLIPLEGGLRAAIFGLTQEEAEKQVVHTTTWGSFSNLLEGNAELIFSCPLSETQKADAEQQRIQLELVPLAKEGFVFVVNAKNPVDTLTQQQLKDIYSGKITNWKQVGGNDAPIVAYQRNTDSGSQNYMIEFMGDTPLMDAPTEKRPSSMGDLMDSIAVNDHAENAIGYSVYMYAADMYGNGNEIKFIQVDGVAPTKNTMADGTYPLLGLNYAVFNAKQPENGKVRTLVNWATSYDGQLALAKAGYVTLEDIGFDYEEKTFKRYEGTGAGGAAPTELSVEKWTAELPVEVKTAADGTVSAQLNCLTDTKLQEEVNQFIATQMLHMDDTKEPYERFISQSVGHIYGIEGYDTSVKVRATAQNGFLSVTVIQDYYCSDGATYWTELNYRAECAVWDLYTGKQLAVEDLFCNGVDVDEVLNQYLKKMAGKWLDRLFTVKMKNDFAALPETGWSMTAESLYIHRNNPYFSDGLILSLDYLPDGVLVTETAREMKGFFTENVRVDYTFREVEDKQAYREWERITYEVIRPDQYPVAAQINQKIETEWIPRFTIEKLSEYFNEKLGADTYSDTQWYWRSCDLQIYGDKYAVFDPPHVPVYKKEPSPKPYEYYPLEETWIFDLTTGQQLEWTELFDGNWRDKMHPAPHNPEYDVQQINMENCILYEMTQDGAEMSFGFIDLEKQERFVLLASVDAIRK